MRNLRIVAALALIAGTAASMVALAADRAAGQMIFDSTCASCHQPESFAGKSTAELERALKGVVAGTTGHPKKLTLNAADIANVAAYMVSAGTK